MRKLSSPGLGSKRTGKDEQDSGLGPLIHSPERSVDNGKKWLGMTRWLLKMLEWRKVSYKNIEDFVILEAEADFSPTEVHESPLLQCSGFGEPSSIQSRA